MPNKQKLCDIEGHNFQLDNEDTTRKTENGGTGIYKTLYCSKCGDTKEIKVAQWAFKSKSEKEF